MSIENKHILEISELRSVLDNSGYGSLATELKSNQSSIGEYSPSSGLTVYRWSFRDDSMSTGGVDLGVYHESALQDLTDGVADAYQVAFYNDKEELSGSSELKWYNHQLEVTRTEDGVVGGKGYIGVDGSGIFYLNSEWGLNIIADDDIMLYSRDNTFIESIDAIIIRSYEDDIYMYSSDDVEIMADGEVNVTSQWINLESDLDLSLLSNTSSITLTAADQIKIYADLTYVYNGGYINFSTGATAYSVGSIRAVVSPYCGEVNYLEIKAGASEELHLDGPVHIINEIVHEGRIEYTGSGTWDSSTPTVPLTTTSVQVVHDLIWTPLGGGTLIVTLPDGKEGQELHILNNSTDSCGSETLLIFNTLGYSGYIYPGQMAIAKYTGQWIVGM